MITACRRETRGSSRMISMDPSRPRKTGVSGLSKIDCPFVLERISSRSKFFVPLKLTEEEPGRQPSPCGKGASAGYKTGHEDSRVSTRCQPTYSEHES